MVVCNVERFLAEAIESILDQTLRDFEFIIVDFGSIDGSTSIISRYQAKDSRIKFRAIPHCRLPEARNACCFLAQGPYIAVMDADDVALEDRLTWQVEFMERNPEVGVLGGAVQVIDDAGKPLRTWRYPSQSGQIKEAVLRHRASFAHPTVVMRKEVFVSVGGYRSAFAAAEDYDLWLRMAERYELANLGTVVLNYRLHPNQATYRNLEQQVICGLAAQAAASMRRNGLPDPLNSVEVITPAVLAGLGIKQETVEKTILGAYRRGVILDLRYGLDFPILPLVSRMLAKLAASKQVQGSVAAGVWSAAARAYLSRGKVLKAVAAAARAFLVHPALAIDIMRRELGRLLRWAGLRGTRPR
jgi:glycosyltransferase involved in cell wall biosynthesis